MRLGKKKEKDKDSEPRSQNVEGVSRLICSAKASHTVPMRGNCDFNSDINRIIIHNIFQTIFFLSQFTLMELNIAA